MNPVAVTNKLDKPTSMHWHGIALQNNTDGAMLATLRNIPAGAEFTYKFSVPDAGTYWRIRTPGGRPTPVVSAADHRRPEGAGTTKTPSGIVMMDDWTDGVGRPADDPRGI